MYAKLSRWIWAAALASTMTLVGCATAPPTKFYALQSTSSPGAALPTAATAQTAGPTIGVGPITLPHYVDRPQIVTEANGNEFALAEFDQWAEPLKDNFSRVLTENVSSMLGTDHVLQFPWRRANSVNYQVTVDVRRFIARPGGQSQLIARWRILNKRGDKELLVKRSMLRVPVNGDDYGAVVHAMNQTVEALSSEISAGVRAVSEMPGPRAMQTDLVMKRSG